MTDVVQRDLQGNILCGYGRTYAHGLFLFLHVEKPARARRWLRDNLPRITTALPWSEPPPHTLNVAFTIEGLEALEVPEGIRSRFPAAFRQGMKARAARLGDTGTNDPGSWDRELDDLHVLVTVNAIDGDVRDARRQELVGEVQRAGFAVASAQVADFGPDDREHFGFRDGISQPTIRDPRAGPWRRTTLDVPVAPGEFVLGYEDEGGTIPAFPPRLGFNGSYMVVRKLEQDVQGFRDFLAEEAGADDRDQAKLAAKILGRWPDGTPLVLSPDAPDRERAQDLGWLNDFSYAFDPEGLSCPLGAHIRRTNPRDSLDRDWRFAMRHRIIRRGMPYGPDGDGGPRGLMFVCYQASLERQFEFVQAQWCNDGNAFGLGSDPDFIVGPDAGKMTIQGNPPRFVPMRRYVTTRGGGYFFAPGLAGLRYIAQAAAGTGAPMRDAE